MNIDVNFHPSSIDVDLYSLGLLHQSTYTGKNTALSAPYSQVIKLILNYDCCYKPEMMATFAALNGNLNKLKLSLPANICIKSNVICTVDAFNNISLSVPKASGFAYNSAGKLYLISNGSVFPMLPVGVTVLYSNGYGLFRLETGDVDLSYMPNEYGAVSLAVVNAP